jgi:glycerate kinase
MNERINRILVAPDKFKGCLSAAQVAQAIGTGVRRTYPEINLDLCPMADGGEGTVEALVAATHGRMETVRVTGPLAEMKVDARFGILGDKTTAVIEMSAASGLALLPPGDRDPTRTTTYGTGELLMAAAAMGVSKIILGIGGSATTDAGIGCAQACGLPVILENGEPLAPTEPLTGADMNRVVLIKHGRGSPIERIKIVVACDVTNPLCGPTGAAHIFSPQKGATPEQVKSLDAALEKLATRTGKTDIAKIPGAGAAGGLGFGMAAFFGATLQPGIEIVMEAVNFSDRLKSADLCITGEGRLDHQSFSGKTAVGVARAAKAAGVPCIALAGSVDVDAREAHANGINAYFSICNGPMSLEQAMRDAEKLLTETAENIARALKLNTHNAITNGAGE